YPETCFHFSDHFLRMIFPSAEKMTVETRVKTPEKTRVETPEKKGTESVNRVGEKVGVPLETAQENEKPSVGTGRASVETGVKTGTKTPEKTLAETRVKTPVQILLVLMEHPTMTLVEVAARIGKSKSAVERAASKLSKEGRLRYVGAKKSGHWEVLK
ncbi:MAG: winged helix-turn-helix domain-containing protein, partial [Nitrospirales bacterium]